VSAFTAIEDNPVSNNMFSLATSLIEDWMIAFALKSRLDALASPQKTRLLE
jgi:hypothetical protein